MKKVLSAIVDWQSGFTGGFLSSLDFPEAFAKAQSLVFVQKVFHASTSGNWRIACVCAIAPSLARNCAAGNPPFPLRCLNYTFCLIDFA